jgi:A/G-specific adenine glycosylase
VKARRARPARRSTLPPSALPFRRRLLGWYARHQRTLPWRGIRDPYAILVSEVMLQQTQVIRVQEFYTRFVGRYPTVEDLAAAPAEAVHDSWAGLGYYARARNLHAAARRVVADHGGTFPAEPEVLRTLPGVGRYTAAAVASFAFDADVATVDTNIQRVLTRVFRLRGPRRTRGRRLWALAGALVPKGRSSDWNQALMDLGATICIARSPRCGRCPVARHCASRQVPERA